MANELKTASGIPSGNDAAYIKDDTRDSILAIGQNRVGIGTTGPIGKFQIKSGQDDALILMRDTGSSDSAIVFKTITGGVVNIQGTNGALNDVKNLALQNEGGNVGVNQTSPDRKLEILDASYPQLRLTQTNDTQFVDLQADSSSSLIINSGTTPLLKIANSSSDVVIQPGGSGKDIIFKDYSGTEVMRIDSSAATVVVASKLKIGSYWTLEG